MAPEARRAQKATRKRAKRIFEIRPGAVTVYTAYLVVCVRLIIVLAHAVAPGLQ